MANAYHRTEPMAEPLWEPELEPEPAVAKADLAWFETFVPTTIPLTNEQKSVLLNTVLMCLTAMIAISWFVMRLNIGESIHIIFKLLLFGWLSWNIIVNVLDLASGVAHIKADRLIKIQSRERRSFKISDDYYVSFERSGTLGINVLKYGQVVKGGIYHISYSRWSKRLLTLHQIIPKSSLIDKPVARQEWLLIPTIIFIVAFWYLFGIKQLDIFYPRFGLIKPTFYWALGEALGMIVAGRLLSALLALLLRKTAK